MFADSTKFIITRLAVVTAAFRVLNPMKLNKQTKALVRIVRDCQKFADVFLGSMSKQEIRIDPVARRLASAMKRADKLLKEMNQ